MRNDISDAYLNWAAACAVEWELLTARQKYIISALTPEQVGKRVITTQFPCVPCITDWGMPRYMYLGEKDSSDTTA